jgi:prepilin-type processing-associated H-X9-DG protein
MKTRRKEPRAGFTLLDLMAMVAMVAILGVFAFPVLMQSAADARAALCAGNLGQVGRAVAMYGDDQNGMLPGNQHSQPSWVEALAKYCQTNSYRCPEEVIIGRHARAYTIALNDFLTPHPYGARQLDFSKRSKIVAPGQTMMFTEAAEEYRAYDHFHFADARENGYVPDAFSDQVEVERHSGAANYLFADGHVDELFWSSGAKPKLTSPGSRFVNPAGHLVRAEVAGR